MRLRGHRVFRDFAWPSSLHSFGQSNLIYGWNGSGKTTLSSLFAHLEKGTNLAEGEVEFEFDDARKCPGTAIADTNLPPVRVFNRDFINATITAAGERVDPIYYLGEASIEKQQSADRLSKERQQALERLERAKEAQKSAAGELDRFCIGSAKVIKELLAGSHNAQYTNYDKRRFKQTMEQIRTETDAKSRCLREEEEDRFRKQVVSQPKEELPLTVCEVPSFSHLSKEATGLLERSVISETLAELTQDEVLARWVQQGMTLHSEEYETEVCRFCKQSLRAERRSALDRHFNDAFSAFQHDIASSISTLEQELGRLSQIAFPDPARAYDHLQEDLTTAASHARETIETARTWLTAVRDALVEKKAAPFSAPEAGTWQSNTPSGDALREAIAALHHVLAKHNGVTGDFRNQVAEACRHLELHHAAGAWVEHAQLTNALEAAEADLPPVKEEIKRLDAEIAAIERDIVEHRRPADELNEELQAYLGRDELRFEVRETGYALTRAGQPVTHLSEGERTAIAFLYFLKSLQGKSFDLAKGVVVIDDPVSSLDENALFSAFGYMKERTKACGQLFVLTHNFGFFRQVKNWFNHLRKERVGGEKRPRARFFFLEAWKDPQAGRNSAIRPLDPLLREYESEYHYLFRRVYDEVQAIDRSSTLEHHYSLPNIARRLLEAFLAFRYPDSPNDLAKRLDRVEFDPGKKTRMLRLLHTYSHANVIGDPGHDPSALAETPSVLRDVLEMMRAADPSHYDALENLATRQEGSP